MWGGREREEDLSSLSPELRVIVKSLSKKDVTTKLRALEELLTHVGAVSSDECKMFLPFWPKLFGRLGLDVEKRIREATFLCHKVMTAKLGRAIAPFLKEMIAAWLCAHHDPAKEVARLAAESFNASFPSKKVEVMSFCQLELVSFVYVNVLKSSPETLSDPRTSSREEMEQKFGRIVSGSILLVASLYEVLSDSEIAKLSEEHSSLMDSTKFWAQCSSSFPEVRAAMYSFIRVLALRTENSVILGHASTIATNFLPKVFMDDCQANMGCLWEAILLLSRAVPQVWTVDPGTSTKFPRHFRSLFQFLRTGANGSGRVSYPALLVLLSSIPSEAMNVNPFFAFEFISNLWCGAKSATVDRLSLSAFFGAYLECIMFFLKRGEMRDQAVTSSFISFETEGLQGFLLPNTIAEQFSPLNIEVIAADLAKHYRKIAELASEGSVPPNFLSAVLAEIPKITKAQLDLLKAHPIKGSAPADLEIYFSRLAVILTAVSQLQMAPPYDNEFKDRSQEIIELSLSSVLAPCNGGIIPVSRFLEKIIHRCGKEFVTTSGMQLKLTNFFCSDLWEICEKSSMSCIPFFGALVRWISISNAQVAETIWSKALSYSISKAVRGVGVLTALLQNAVEVGVEIEESPELKEFSLGLLVNQTEEAYNNDLADLYNVILTAKNGLFALSFKTCIVNKLFDMLSDVAVLYCSRHPRSEAPSVSLVSKILERLISGSPALFNQYAHQVEGKCIVDICCLGTLCSPEDDDGVTLYRSIWTGLQANFDLTPFRREFANRFKSYCVSPSFGRSNSGLKEFASCAIQLYGSNYVLAASEMSLLYSQVEELRHSASAVDLLSLSTVDLEAEELSAVRVYFRAIDLSIFLADFIDCSAYISGIWSVGQGWLLGELYTFLGSMSGCTASEDVESLIGRVTVSVNNQFEVLVEPGRLNPAKWHLEIVTVLDSLLINAAPVIPSEKSIHFVVDAFRRADALNEVQIFESILASAFGVIEIGNRELLLWMDLVQSALAEEKFAIVIALLRCLGGRSFDFRAVTKIFKQSAAKFNESEEKHSGSTLLDILTLVLRLMNESDGNYSDPFSEISEGVVLVVRKLRAFFGASELSLSTVPSSVLCSAANFVIQLVKMEFDFDLNMSGFLTKLMERLVLDTHVTADKQLCCACKLFLTLSTARMEQKEIWAAVERNERLLQERLLDMFLGLNPGRSASMDLQSVLSDIAVRLSDDLIDRHDLDLILPLLNSSNESVKKSAFKIIKAKVHRNVESLVVQLEMKTLPAEHGLLSISLLAAIQRPVESTGSLKLIQSEGFSYCLHWLVLFSHFDNATFDLKSEFLSQLKRADDLLSSFLNYIFSTLGILRTGRVFDPSKWDFNDYEVDGFDSESELSFRLLAAHLYLKALKFLPTVVRSWWTSCKNRQTIAAIESFTEKYFSPILVTSEFDLIANLDKSRFEDMKVKVSRMSNEVTAIYTIDEASIIIVLRVPPCFPLRLVDVDSGSGGRIAGITEARWRAWLLSISIMAQNSSILDALNLFQRNVTLHFEGVEDCAICYAVVGVIDRSLPSKTCRTCKNCFHAACLYKWFKSSNQSSCPLCRAVF